MRPQSSVGFGENIHKLKNSDKTMFYVFGEVKAMLAPTLLNGAYDFELEIIVQTTFSIRSACFFPEDLPSFFRVLRGTQRTLTGAQVLA